MPPGHGPAASFPSWEFMDRRIRIKVNESCPGSVETMKILKEAIEAVRSDPKISYTADPAEVRRAKVFLRDALNSI